MYPSLRDPRSRTRGTPAEGRRWWRPAVTSNVVGLGLTSMFTDVSSEMVNAIVPLFVITRLGFSEFQVGVFAGLYQAIAVFAALATAGIADRRRRYKEVAGAGYAVSSATKLGLLAVRTSWLPATALFYADRVAKGVRTAPRDALISLSALPGRLGEAFGFHRTLDTAGALVGPFVAFVILSVAPGDFQTVFLVSFWISLIGVAVLVLFVHNRAPASEGAASGGGSFLSAFRLLRAARYRSLVIAATVLSLVTVSDVLLYLTFQQRSSMTPRYFPLLYVGTAVSYVLLALPLGRLADRIPPARVFLAGQALLIPVDLILLRSGLGPVALFAMLGLFGAYFAATDGVLAALATGILPDASRRWLALLSAAMTVGKLVASVAYGLLWQEMGSTFVLRLFLAGLVVGITVSAVLLRPQLRSEGGVSRAASGG